MAWTTTRLQPFGGVRDEPVAQAQAAGGPIVSQEGLARVHADGPRLFRVLLFLHCPLPLALFLHNLLARS